MKYSLQVCILLCVINLFDVRCFGTVAAHYLSNHHEDNDADSTNNHEIVVPLKGCGCDKHTHDSDSYSDSSSSYLKRNNEILIDNTKHFHDHNHNHNYLLIGLDSSEEDHHNSYEHVRRNEKKIHLLEDDYDEEEEEEPESEEETYDEDYEAAIGDGTYIIDPPRRPKAHPPPSTCEKKVISALKGSKLNDGRRGDLKQSRYLSQAVEDDRDFNPDDLPLRDDRRRGDLKQSRYLTRALEDRREPYGDFEGRLDNFDDLV